MTHFHNYMQIYNSHEATVEVCQKAGCHKRFIARKGPNGTFDYRTYNTEHLRDTLQPGMKGYEKEYGN